MSGARVPPIRRLQGEVRIPGDKSISHRGVILGSIARGRTRVSGFLAGDDPLATVGAFRQMGVKIERLAETDLAIDGVGLGGLRPAAEPIDVGNSGTTIRLLAGLLAAQAFPSVLDGDASIRRRPMGRVMAPLREMGARIEDADGKGHAPLKISGLAAGEFLRAVAYKSPVASAQVKSALLLAGLFAKGRTCVMEPAPSRDHTERMLSFMGVPVERGAGGVCIEGGRQPVGAEIQVPGDISSAAFLLVAGLLSSKSDLILKDVGVNPTRDGILEVLGAMGAKIEIRNRRERSGEPVADLHVHPSPLRGTRVGGAVIPRLIDEIPVLAVAACFAQGETIISDAAELRVKESDRIQTMTVELGKLGIRVEPLPDGLKIQGDPRRRVSGGAVDSHGDHRVAMSLAVCGVRSEGEIAISDVDCVQTSFPGFFGRLQELS